MIQPCKPSLTNYTLKSLIPLPPRGAIAYFAIYPHQANADELDVAGDLQARHTMTNWTLDVAA